MKGLRFKLWWVFRSPWARQKGRVRSFYGYLTSFLSTALSPKEISLCVSCANRFDMLEKVFIPAYKSLEHEKKIKLYISCPVKESDLISSLCKDQGVEAEIIPCAFVFSRSTYLNEAIKRSESKHLFLSDIDIALPSNLYHLYYANVKEHRAWFPICQLLDKENKVVREYPEGVGVVGFFAKTQYLLDAKIKTWGNEDWSLLMNLYAKGVYPFRTRNNGFWHHYHDEVDKKNYKKNW